MLEKHLDSPHKESVFELKWLHTTIQTLVKWSEHETWSTLGYLLLYYMMTDNVLDSIKAGRIRYFKFIVFFSLFMSIIIS